MINKKIGFFIILSLFLLIIMLCGCTDDGEEGTNDGDNGTNDDDDGNGEYVLIAKASVDRHSGPRPFKFNLSAEGSLGEIVSYQWLCASTGQKSEGKNPSRWILSTPGDYAITLTVTDIYGDTDTDTVYVTVEE
jgi:hypothetical protein